MYYLIRYEIAVNDQEITEELMAEANSRTEASDYVLGDIQSKYADRAVLLHLDISPNRPEPTLPDWLVGEEARQ